MDHNISTEAKIDYIYETLRKQESRYKWGMFIKWGFRIFILIYIYVFFIYMLPSLMSSFTQNLIPGSTQNFDTQKLIKMAGEYFKNNK